MNGQIEEGKDDARCLIAFSDDDIFKKLVDIFDGIKKKITEKTWDVVEYGKDYLRVIIFCLQIKM